MKQSLKRLRRKVRNNGFTTKSMRSPRPEFRAQPAGRSLRNAAARTARRTRQQRRRNHPPGPVAGRGAPVGASRPRVQGRFFTSFRMTKRRGATSDTRQQNCKHPTVIPRRDNKRPPPTRKRPRKKKAAGKSKQKTTTNRKRAKTIKKNRKTSDKAPPKNAPRIQKERDKKREPPNGDSLKNAAERPTRGSDRK